MKHDASLNFFSESEAVIYKSVQRMRLYSTLLIIFSLFNFVIGLSTFPIFSLFTRIDVNFSSRIITSPVDVAIGTTFVSVMLAAIAISLSWIYEGTRISTRQELQFISDNVEWLKSNSMSHADDAREEYRFLFHRYGIAEKMPFATRDGGQSYYVAFNLLMACVSIFSLAAILPYS